MKKKIYWGVFHTTETGADYLVSRGFIERTGATAWEFENRDKFERPLIVRKIVTH